MIEKMGKVEMLFLIDDPEIVLRYLQKKGSVHLEETATPAEGKLHFKRFHISGILQKRIEKYTAINKHIEHIHNLYGQRISSLDEVPGADFNIDTGKVSSRVRNLDKKFSKFSRRKKNLRSDLEDLRQYIPVRNSIARGLDDYSGEFDRNFPVALLAVPEDETRMLHMLDEIVSRSVEEDRYEIVRMHYSDPVPTVAVMIYCDEKYSGHIWEDLWEDGFSELRFPNFNPEKPLSVTVAEFDDLIRTIPENIKKIDQKIKALFDSNSEYLISSYHAIGAALQRYHQLPKLARTEKCIIANGWIPENQLEKFESALTEDWSDRAILNEIGIIHDEIESIPTLYRNPRFSSRFEKLLKLFPPAVYGSYDPTVLNSITFPLFFGFMLGDIGYGLLIILLANFLLKKLSKPFAFVGTIMLYCGISSVVFGILYWEFLGDMIDNARLFSFLPLIHRQQHVDVLMMISLLIGGIHISIGFILGGLKELRKRKTKKAFGEFSVVAFIWSSFAIVGSLKVFSILPEYFLMPGVIMLGVSILIILFTSGVFSVMELFSTLSNILSYSRLMAIGFSSVILANIANLLGGSVGNVLVGIMIGLVFHLINLVLGMFGPAIHALRLHYVEFMPKFYEANGRDYKPFEYKMNNF